MRNKSLLAALRLFLAFMVGLAGALPAYAQVTIFSPFNIAEAMDQGVKKAADIAYADGKRKKLDVYFPANVGRARPRW